MERKLVKQGLYDPAFEHDACGIGAVVNINGKKDHAIIEYGKETIMNLHHRGAAGADDITGDGAGILFQIPHDFFKSQSKRFKVDLPQPGRYGVGMVFGSKDPELRTKCDRILEAAITHYGMKVIGWRDVPSKPDCLGKIALSGEPSIKQIFVAAGKYDSEGESQDSNRN